MNRTPHLCPNCGAVQRRPDARFCHKCGQTLMATDIQSESKPDSQRGRFLLLGGALLTIVAISVSIAIIFGRMVADPGLSNHEKGTEMQRSISTETQVLLATKTFTPTASDTPALTALSPTVTSSPLRTPTYTPSTTNTSCPTPIVSRGPQLVDVIHRETNQQGNLIIHKDIHFIDPDGDAKIVTYTVLHSDIENYYVEDDPITATAEQQKQGTFVTATWKCGSQSYQITLNARIIDEAGHQSPPFKLVFDCRR